LDFQASERLSTPGTISEWQQSERKLAIARETLSKRETSQEDNTACLREANTGKFWDKFGSIAGMCRASWIYETRGWTLLSIASEKEFYPKGRHLDHEDQSVASPSFP